MAGYVGNVGADVSPTRFHVKVFFFFINISNTVVDTKIV